jgi:outer membrane receptor protein involved in Fe transport
MKFIRKSALSAATCLQGATFAAALMSFGAATSVHAQATAPAADCVDANADGVCDSDQLDATGGIVVTGSRIRRPNLESTVPITSIAGESFFQQGQTNIGDALNDLPQLRSTFAQQNPGLGIGIAGLNLLDLRGLGTQRTLVLVNGRRHVPADILNNAVSVDVNTIPNDLIERVDIVTGGDSAIYGSDAIAGVVNFVLRQNYSGFQVRGQAGITEHGFGGNQYVSAMYGHNFADGAGNITLHGEYARTNRVFASDVPAFRTNDNFLIVDADGGAGIVNGGDGFPDRQFFTNISSASIYFNGLVPIDQKNVANAGLCGNGTTAANGAPNTAGAAFNCTYIFTPEGRLIQQTGTRFGTGIIGSIVNSNGQTGREGKTVSVLPFTERFNFNMLAHYEFSPAATVFLEAKWNRVNALGNNAGPSFIQGTFGTTDFRERTRLDNPFLNPTDATTLKNLILTSGCNTSLTATCPAAGNLSATDIANLNNGSYRFVISRNLLDVGLRDEKFQRDTYRIVGGLKGTFNNDWNYEFSVNYGKFKEHVTTDGFIDRQRFALAMDAGRNPITGAIQCRSQFDPASAVPLVGFAGDPAVNAARLAADIAACVPYNPFGAPNNTASVNYFSREFTAHSSLSQFVASAFVSGDSSGFFNLQGGPIGFAVGAEYRRESAFYSQDPFVTNGFTNGVSIPTFSPTPFEVKEAYTEMRIPVLKDVPFFKELTFSGAARVASYQGKVGTQWAYNFGADWAPVDDLRFRANYSRAVRAPNVSETGFPLVPNFSNGFQDPCNPLLIGSGVRQANCLADIGAALLPTIPTAVYSLPIVSGSNPNLDSEKSTSYTYGVVIQPHWIPGMSLSVDYYNIRVKGVIASIAPQTLVNQCYDSPTLANVFCSQFTRWRGPGNGPLGELPGQILGNSLINAPLNFAARVRRGIDVDFSYHHKFGALDFDTSLIYVHTLTNSNYQDPTNPNFETRVNGQLGDPKDEFRWDFDFGVGPVTLGYRAHYIGPMYYAAYASSFPINGLPATDVDAFPNLKFPSVWYHDVRIDFDIAKSYKFYVGVDNVLNQGVPQGATTATGAGSAIYSFRGRNFYAGFRARF